MALVAPTQAWRVATFGAFRFAAEPKPTNPESVRILGGWDALNMTMVSVPQLNRHVCCNHKAVKPLLALFAAWEAAGLLPLIHTFNGCYSARFKRQTGTIAERMARCAQLGADSLSNHCYGSAIDLNAPELPLGRALPPGHPMEALEPLANSLGWFWGQRFSKRSDPMHWELAAL